MNNKLNLNPYYIIGLIQANGNFHITIKKNNNNILLLPKFNLTLHKKDEPLIIAIKQYFNTGYYKIDNKGYCRYNISNLNDIINIIIPFFLKYQLKNNKFINFIKFKILCEKLLNKKNNNNDVNLLYLINLAYHINPTLNNRSLTGKQQLLKYFNKNEKIIISNKNIYYKNLIDNEINLFKLNNSINIDYIKGLFDGNGNIKVYLSNLKIRINFNIINEDKLLLDNIKLYFNNIGNIIKINNKNYKYEIKNINEINKNILSKFNNFSNGINYNIKLSKLMRINQIMELINENNNNQNIINKQQLIKYININYYIFENKENITLSKYKIDMLNKYKNLKEKI